MNIKIENFEFIKKLDLSITPIHALIGPNNSGKTTILQAINNIVYKKDALFIYSLKPDLFNLPYPAFLIIQPENGVYPSEIKSIMKTLRKISESAQIIIETHSPLVINEMMPEEVTFIWRDKKGDTQAIPLKDTHDFKIRSKVYALGELWLSYCSGGEETFLRTGME